MNKIKSFGIKVGIAGVSMLAMLIAGIAIDGGSVTTASAAPGNGAITDRFQDCESDGWFTFCVNTKAETNSTLAGSGNFNYFSHWSSDFTVADYASGNVVYRSESDENYKWHYRAKAGVLQVFSDRYSSAWEYPGLFGCDYDVDFHVANGQVVRDNVSLVCTP